jgi:hypothetical protein
VTSDVQFAREFGTHLGDGEKAARIRLTRLQSGAALGLPMTLDFTGVRSVNSSFMNALLAGLVEEHGMSAVDRLTFKGCNPAVRVLVEAAIDLGLQKAELRTEPARGR